MWSMIEAVKDSRAAGVSAGNTGALMAMSMLALRKMEGVRRPAMTAVSRLFQGQCVVRTWARSRCRTADRVCCHG